MTNETAQPTNVGSNDQLGLAPERAAVDAPMCVWCETRVRGACKSHYDTLTCEHRVIGPPEPTVRPERAAFERWAKVNRKDLDLRYMYDEKGNYHYDGYIWSDAADAYRIWCAAVAERHQMMSADGGRPIPL